MASGYSRWNPVKGGWEDYSAKANAQGQPMGWSLRPDQQLKGNQYADKTDITGQPLQWDPKTGMFQNTFAHTGTQGGGFDMYANFTPEGIAAYQATHGGMTPQQDVEKQRAAFEGGGQAPPAPPAEGIAYGLFGGPQPKPEMGRMEKLFAPPQVQQPSNIFGTNQAPTGPGQQQPSDIFNKKKR